MRDVLEVLVPGVVVCMIFLVVFGFIAFIRYLEYKETVALAERGLLRQKEDREQNDKIGATRNWGIVIFITGIGLTIGLSMIGGSAAIFGIIATFFGLSLIVLSRVNRHKGGEESEEVVANEPASPHKMQNQ